MSERRIMNDAEATAFILAFLADGSRRTTQEVEAATASEGVQCPDSPVKFLMKLQLRHLIDGELDTSVRTFVWWIPPARRVSAVHG
jgi:hypothetical protein